MPELANQQIRVTVLKGGVSKEREISLQSGSAVAAALHSAGYIVTEIDLTSRLLPTLAADVVFPVLHGEWGEDGEVQKLLEEQGIKYVGCDSTASALMMNKRQTLELLRSEICCPQGIYTDKPIEFPTELNLPIMVKPNSQGSTIGLTKVDNAADWDAAIAKVFAVDSIAIIEEFIEGVECTVGMVNGEALPVVEIIPPGVYFDFDAKYAHNNGDTQYNCPPTKISAEQQAEAQEIAKLAWSRLDCRHLTRFDFIINDNGVYFLEGNSMPGFTASSLLPKSANQIGLDFENLCSVLVRSALET